MGLGMNRLAGIPRFALEAFLFFACAITAIACAFPQLAFADENLLTAGEVTDSASQAEEVSASISYAASAGGSWAWQSDGVANTMAKGKQAKGLILKVSSSLAGSVQYQVYVNGAGWQGVKTGGKVAGGVGKNAKPFGAVRIALTGELATQFDVRYSVLSSTGKWQAWKQNGQQAGKAGAKLRGIRVQLVKKSAPSTRLGTGIVGVRYRVKMQGSSKWQIWKANNATAGKAGKAKRVQNIVLSLDKGSYTGTIKYRVRLANGKWKSWKNSGKAIGNLKNIEAIQVKLTGSIAKEYDVVYRTYASGVGWQARVRNGATAGTAKGRRIEAVRIQLVKKTRRSGWVGSGKSWAYYKNGKPVKNQWVTTSESPINVLTAASHKYWIDASGKLAVSRIVNPKNTADSGARFKAYATKWGYISIDQVFEIGDKWYITDESGVLEAAGKASVLIERYVRWAIDIANDSSHGYTQDLERRWGFPDYDCSSLAISAVRSVGLKTGDAAWTGNMRSELTKYGFVWHWGTSDLKRGDILLVHNSRRQHTEIYIGNGQTVGAHIAETGDIYGVGGDQTGHEIDVSPYDSSVGWEGYLRFGS